jgi:REP element-mobilizing transposase RayT
MSQGIVKAYLHIVFSTKRREPLIDGENENPLFNYVNGICRNLRCWPVRIGGHKDHIHILCHLHKDVPPTELIDQIKISTVKWMRSRFDSARNFSWQQGFACLSVSECELPVLSHYIETQREHHASLTYEAELRRLLVENDIEVDEHSMWK